jgi:hypothetical protein
MDAIYGRSLPDLIVVHIRSAYKILVVKLEGAAGWEPGG